MTRLTVRKLRTSRLDVVQSRFCLCPWYVASFLGESQYSVGRPVRHSLLQHLVGIDLYSWPYPRLILVSQGKAMCGFGVCVDGSKRSWWDSVLCSLTSYVLCQSGKRRPYSAKLWWCQQGSHSSCSLRQLVRMLGFLSASLHSSLAYWSCVIRLSTSFLASPRWFSKAPIWTCPWVTIWPFPAAADPLCTALIQYHKTFSAKGLHSKWRSQQPLLRGSVCCSVCADSANWSVQLQKSVSVIS